MRGRILLVAVVLLGFASHASAQTVRGQEADSFTVRIGILSTCTAIAANSITFGENIPSAISISATGNVSVYCTVGQSYSVGLSEGDHHDGSTRNMANNGTLIPYTLSATLNGDNWGDTENVDRVTGTGSGMVDATPHTVYAKATLRGDEPSGTYEDTVTATLYF